MRKLLSFLFAMAYSAASFGAGVQIAGDSMLLLGDYDNSAPIEDPTATLLDGTRILAPGEAEVSGDAIIVFDDKGQRLRTTGGKARLTPADAATSKYYSIYQQVGTVEAVPIGDPVDPPPPVGLLTIPDPGSPTSTPPGGEFYAGTMNTETETFYSPTGQGFDWAYWTATTVNPTPKVAVQLHAEGAFADVLTPRVSTNPDIIGLATQDGEAVGNAEYWGYALDGNPYPGRRLGLALDYLESTYTVDKTSKGVSLTGTSMGGAGAIQQTMILPTPWRSRIAHVSSTLGMHLPRRVELVTPSQTLWPADDGNNDAIWDAIDFDLKAAGDPTVRRQHYRLRFSTDDPLDQGPDGSTGVEFVNICEREKISCAASWVQNGHDANETGYVNLYDLSKFETGQTAPLLDKAIPAFTNSTGNWPTSSTDRLDESAFPRGHYNMGLVWDVAGTVDTSSTLSFPIKYERRTGLGTGISDQPAIITVDVTPRRTNAFAITHATSYDWDWDNGAQTGNIIAVGDTVTIPGITLTSGDAYKTLTITRTAVTGVDIPIVYSWSPRHLEGFTMSGSYVEPEAASVYGRLPDTANWIHGFPEANAVYRYANGTEVTMFDCVNTTLKCAALDPKVSPDATKVAFWVVYFDEIRTDVAWSVAGTAPIPMGKGPNRATLYFWDVATETVSELTQSTVNLEGGGTELRTIAAPDRYITPEWISNTKLVFSKFYQAAEGYDHAYGAQVAGSAKATPYCCKHTLTTADIDLSDVNNPVMTNETRIAKHHSQATHPFVLSDGRILVGTLQIEDQLGHNQGNGQTTLQNQWWLNILNPDGSGEFTVFGAHGLSYMGIDPYNPANETTTQSILALHYLGESSDGWALSGNYYRMTHQAGGQNLAFQIMDHGVEGKDNTLQPRLATMTPWGQEEDNPTARDETTGLHRGNAAFPVGLPNDEYMFMWGRGYCFAHLEAANANSVFLNGGPGCDPGIYKQTGKVSTNPWADLVPIVDRPDRAEFAPDIALPYSAIYGKSAPDPYTPITPTGTCTLEVTDARVFTPAPFGVRCTNGGKSCFGSDVSGYLMKQETPTAIDVDVGALIDKLVIMEVLENTTTESQIPDDQEPPHGYFLSPLGYANLETDGSIKVEVPCQTPFRMWGMDASNNLIARDQISHSLVDGEDRRCMGCHGGHSEDEFASMGGMTAFDLKIAAGKAAQTLQPITIPGYN